MADTPLSVFFQPQGIAVVGASRTPGKLGHDTVRNLVQHGYSGAIYPINPVAGEIFGCKCHASIADVPDPVDLAIIVLPAPQVKAAVAACGERGVKGVIVISGGFREIGEAGAIAEAELEAIANQYDIALVGPNCIGTIDTHTPLNTTFIVGHPEPGHVGFASQSGALVATLLDWAQKNHMGFSRIVSLGNQVGVSEADMLAEIADDPHTKVICAYLEGVADGQKFLATARQISTQKPLIALKVGRGQGAARAIASHTGSLAGAEVAYNAAFQRAGVLRAATLEEMLNWGQALAMQPLPRGNRVAILTNAGGPGILATDALDDAGITLAELSEATRAYLRQHVPPAASVENPVDILAGTGTSTYAVCLEALIQEETVDAVVVITAPQDWFPAIELARVVVEAAQKTDKPILTAIMGPTPDSDAALHLREHHIPNYAFPEQIGSVLGAMWRYRQWLDTSTLESPSISDNLPDRVTAQTVIEAGQTVLSSLMEKGDIESGESGWMVPNHVDTLLKAYHIRTPRIGLAPTALQAINMAQAIGYPVALKLAASGVSHKTDVGGVVLNLQTPEAVETEFEAMLVRGKSHLSDKSTVEGVYVQHMIRGYAEIIIGAIRDPQFGPMVMVGSGGTQVELLGDVAFELAPLTRRQADAMLDRITIGKLLAGYRGQPAADREAVTDVIQAIAQIILDWSQMQEIEINPLMVMPAGKGVYAVDTRVQLAVSSS